MIATPLPSEIARLHLLQSFLRRAVREQSMAQLQRDELPADLREAAEAAGIFHKMDDGDEQPFLVYKWVRFLEAELAKASDVALLISLDLGASGPLADDLFASPLLTEWTPAKLRFQGDICLIGTNEGHPQLFGTAIFTSRLCGLDVQRNWARTLSRWYRLGRLVSLEELAELHGDRIFRMGAAAVTVEEARDWLHEERIDFS